MQKAFFPYLPSMSNNTDVQQTQMMIVTDHPTVVFKVLSYK